MCIIEEKMNKKLILIFLFNPESIFEVNSKLAFLKDRIRILIKNQLRSRYWSALNLFVVSICISSQMHLLSLLILSK